MNQFVGEYVFQLRVRTREGQQYAVLVEFRHAARALADEAGQDIGLLEIGMGSVEDDRDFVAEPVLQYAAQAVIGPLRHPRGIVGRLFLSLVEVNFEVGRGDDFPLEVAVLDLVPPEVIPLGERGRRHGQQAQESQNEPQPMWHFRLLEDGHILREPALRVKPILDLREPFGAPEQCRPGQVHIRLHEKPRTKFRFYVCDRSRTV